MPVVQFDYKGTKYPDFSFIDLGDYDVDDSPRFEFDVVNDSVYNIEGIKLVTNMPDGSKKGMPSAFEATVPKNIVPYSDKLMTLTIFNKVLFESNWPGLWDPKRKKNVLAIRLDYTRTRRFTL